MIVQFDLELQRGFEIAGIMVAMIAVLSAVVKVYAKIEKLEVSVAEMRVQLGWVVSRLEGRETKDAPSP